MANDLRTYWKTIVDTMMDGLVVVDTEGTVLSVNRALKDITGYTEKDLVGKSCTILDCDRCFSVGPGGIKEKNCALFSSGEVVRRRCQLRKKDGSALYALKNATLLKDSDGVTIGGVETLTDISDLVEKERAIEELKDLLSPGEGFEGIIGKASKMLDTYELIQNAATSDAPVIIYGESGTGKELVASAIHRLGRRNKGPLVKVSCAALNESLLESELFGHVKGAFTGAGKDRKGRFEAAHKGDLFLDEIGDIPLSTQVKLLRVLQEKEVERVGDQTPIPIDVRIIAATHRDLSQMCREGQFRDDLYYRLNVIPIHLAPLRERREDIPVLVDHFGRILRARTDKAIHGVTEQAMEKMVEYAWPGNVRELINVLEYAFVVCHEDLISAQHLPPLIVRENHIPTRPRVNKAKEDRRDELVKVLETAHGNRQEAARLLGVSRVTLWKLLKKHGVEVEATVKSQGQHGE
jgi:two-component system, NtrC family, response regulator HydG